MTKSLRESRPHRIRAGNVRREGRGVDPGSWDCAAIAAAMSEWAALVGRAPRAHEWTSNGIGAGAARWLSEHPRWPSAGAVVYHYGSWSRALEAAGLPSLFVEHELPRRERVATAVALRAAGETVASIADQLGVHPRTVHRYLTAGACRSCGGPALYGEHCRQCFPRHGPAATKPELVRALRAWTTEHGQPPREQDWRGSSPVWAAAWPRWPGTATVLRVFAGWNAALEAAGLPTHRYAWDPDEALEALTAWARAHGRPPSIADANHDRDLPSPATYQELHGSWNAALRAAGLTPTREAQWDDDQIHAALARWARWHTQHESGEPSAASYRHWAARQPAPVPSASSIRRRFGGSWNAARLAAGLPASRGGRPRER